MIETTCETFNIGHHGTAVMADFEGAFDATWRKGLIFKLYKAGVKSMVVFLVVFLNIQFSQTFNFLNAHLNIHQ